MRGARAGEAALTSPSGRAEGRASSSGVDSGAVVVFVRRASFHDQRGAREERGTRTRAGCGRGDRRIFFFLSLCLSLPQTERDKRRRTDSSIGDDWGVSVEPLHRPSSTLLSVMLSSSGPELTSLTRAAVRRKTRTQKCSLPGNAARRGGALTPRGGHSRSGTSRSDILSTVPAI